MKKIYGIELNDGNREEVLPGFSEDFPYIATRAELDYYIEPVIPWHWHRTVELFYMESGTLEYSTPKGKWVFPAGSGGFLNSNVLHASRLIPSGACTVQLLHLFDPVLLAGARGSRMEEKYILPLTASPEVELLALYPDVPEHRALLGEIRSAFDLSEEDWGWEFSIREAMGKIWLKLFDLAHPSDRGVSRQRDDTIKELMIHIHEHFSEPITVDDLARSAHISRRTCFRLFQENLRMTPLEYLRGYRLQRACQMLTQTEEPVTRIAGDCALGSASYFGKQFRERFGCSPAQFRKKWHDRDSLRHGTDSGGDGGSL